MKKLLALLLTVITLSACTSNEMTITNGNDVIISGDDITLTKQEFYNKLKDNDFTQVIINDLSEKIAKLENIDTSDIDGLILQDLSKLKEQYGDSYESAISYYGGEDTLKANLRSRYITEKLANNYFENNFEELKTTYMPKKIKMAYFENEDAAKGMIESINVGKTFEMAAAENGYGSTITESVVTDKSELAVELKEFIYNASEAKLSDVIKTTTTSKDAGGNDVASDRYYVVEITNTDVNSFKEDFFNALNGLISTNEVYNFYFAKYDIEVYDQDAYNYLSPKFEGIK